MAQAHLLLVAPALSEEEIFARKGLEELNAERPVDPDHEAEAGSLPSALTRLLRVGGPHRWEPDMVSVR